MRIVPFWRTSLSDSKSQSRQFYFDRFEIHPIKVKNFPMFPDVFDILIDFLLSYAMLIAI